MKSFRSIKWSPYLVGALIGMLSWFAFATAKQPIGVTTAFVQTAGLAERAVADKHVASNAYFAKIPPRIGWEWMLVAGIFFGALLSSWLSGDRSAERVPLLWAQRFGPSRLKRYTCAFVGGAFLMFGARLAGGCTSGHGISGSLQLALSSWTFFLSLFLSGVVAAFFLYGKEPRHV